MGSNLNSTEKTVLVPDIGTDAAVKVIEINVKIGDSIEVEDTLITLESEKASMEIPAPFAGVVKNIKVKVGDSVSTGSVILSLEMSNNQEIQEIQETQNPIENKPAEPKLTENKPSENKSVNKSVNKIITVPDIGTDAAVKVIEVNVKIGDSIAAEDTLITLESEKASMEIPAPSAGIVKNIEVKVGDSVKTGSVILGLEVIEQLIDKPAEKSAEKTPEKKSEQSTEKPIEKFIEKPQPAAVAASNLGSSLSYASPSVRRFAKELGVNLTKVQGTGRKGRLVKQDIEQYIKTQLSKLESGTGTQANAVNLPVIDFSKFGEVSTKPLTRIQKLSANNLQRNWTMIPHVTQFDEADITDLESFRQKYKDQAESKGYKLTPLVFLLKAAAQVLKALPKFNVSLTNDGENFIQKYYYHIGVAVDTPNGLVVPVIRNVDQKGLFQLAQELAEQSQKARDGKLTAKDMQGSCFTISSLGGIGGTAFTPIINFPDVAILGVSKSQYKPVYQNGQFVPRLMLPLSLSYDHRAIDGADGARFITLFSKYLGEISQLLL